MCFEINRTILIVGSKFTVFALFYFVFEGNFPSISPPGAYNGGFFSLPFWGPYIWRGLFWEVYGKEAVNSLVEYLTKLDT